MERATLVIEAVYENLELKQNLFEKIDSILPEEIPIASNTSGLRITDISSRTVHTERTLTAHFWFPAHLVPLVEVVMGEKTDEAVAVMVKERLAGWGKAPVLVRKDLPGQLANRILQAVIREAVNIVEMGLASPEDVDTAVKWVWAYVSLHGVRLSTLTVWVSTCAARYRIPYCLLSATEPMLLRSSGN